MSCLPMRPPEPSTGLAQRALLLLVRGYRLFFKAWVGNVCRYEPSCSSYMMQDLIWFGLEW